jgi:TetR/AcrR family transcriptional repressor of nem operon
LKVSRKQAAKNRDRVLEAASKLFRKKGIHGVSVPEIMRAAHLTHGGFYAQFKSKRDLERQALELAAARSMEWVEEQIRIGKDRPFEALVKDYLAHWHRDKPEISCSLSSIGPDSYRNNPAVRRVLTDLYRAFLGRLTDVAPKGAASRRGVGLSTLASLVGAMVLARAVDDRKLSDEILETVRQSLVHRSRRQTR